MKGAGSAWDTQMFPTAPHLSGCPVSASWSPRLPTPGFPSQAGPVIVSLLSARNPGFYEDPSSTGGPDSPPSTFCGDSGFSGSGSYGRLGPSEPRGIYASERPKSLGKVGGVGALRAKKWTLRRWF